MTYYFIDDNASRLGGAELTLQAIKNHNLGEIVSIDTPSILSHTIDQDGMYVLGNIARFNIDIVKALYQLTVKARFVKIEFDYGYCAARGPICHKHLLGSECTCPDPKSVIGQLYRSIWDRSKRLYYMSADQAVMHAKAANIGHNKQIVINSAFDEATLTALKANRTSTQPRNKYMIIDGRPGWHRTAKGVGQAIKWAKEHNLPYDLVQTDTHEELLRLMGKYKGLIFLPIIHDTCPRVTIEAKLSGCEVITSELAQHTTEYWWSWDLETMESYIRNGPVIFWHDIRKIKDGN